MKIKHLKYWLVYIGAILALQEVLFRIFFPLPEIKNLDRVDYLVTEADGNEAYCRDQSWYWESIMDTNHQFIHRMNKYGFRDNEWKVHSEKERILFIGDSFVEGIMAEQHESIPKVVEANFQGELVCMNAGMVGAGLESYMKASKHLVPLFEPKKLVVCIYANDLGSTNSASNPGGFKPEFNSPLVPRVWEIIEQGSSKGPLLSIFGTKPKRYLPAVPDSRNPWTNQSHELSTFTTPNIANEMSKGRFNPFMVNSIDKEFDAYTRQPGLSNIPEKLKHLCDQNGTKLTIVYIPSRHQVTDKYRTYALEYCSESESIPSLTADEFQQHAAILAKTCAENNISYLNLTGIIKKEEQKENLYWNYDEHFNSKGYRLAADKIYEKLNPVLSSN